MMEHPQAPGAGGGHPNLGPGLMLSKAAWARAPTEPPAAEMTTVRPGHWPAQRDHAPPLSAKPQAGAG